MILVLGSVVAREGCVLEALALSQEHVTRSRTEAGCISHAVHRDTENPNRLVFVEQWASRDVLWDHFRVPTSRSFVKSLTALAAEPPSLAIYEATAVAAPR
jgi:quinol monooxygenase YgiN